MPRRSILSATERDTLLALPDSQDDLIRYYTFNESDLSLIRQRRGDANRLGFAVQLCLLRYPGYALASDSVLPDPVIEWVARQVQAAPESWPKYGERDVTRREHAQELRTYLGLLPFGLSDFRALVRELTNLAQQTDKSLLLAGQALESLRQQRRILPTLTVIDRACSEAVARANRRVYRALIEPLSQQHRNKLDELLTLKAGSNSTWLTWLRQSPLKPNSRHIMEHIERLKIFQLVGLPEGLDRLIHQNRLLKLAREGGQEQRWAQDHDRLQSTLHTSQESLILSRSAQEQLARQLAELKQIHQALEQRHVQDEQCLADTRTKLAVAERERRLLADRFTQAESQLTELAREQQRLLQDNAVLNSQLVELRTLPPNPPLAS